MLDRPILERKNVNKDPKPEDQKMIDFEIVENDELKLNTEGLNKLNHV